MIQSSTDRRVATQAIPLDRTRKTSARSTLIGLALLVVLMATLACTGDLSPEGGWASPVPAGDWIYQATRQGSLIRMHSKTGQLDQMWKFPPEGQKFGVIYGTPLVTEEAVYAAAYTCRGDKCEARVYAISTRDATTLWSEQHYALETQIVGPLAKSGDTLLFGTADIARDRGTHGYLYAIDTRADADKPLSERIGNRFKWRVPVEGKVWGGVTVANGVAYLGSMDRRVYAVDLSDSLAVGADRVLWSFEAEGAIVGRPVVVDSKIYVGDFKGRLYRLDRDARSADLTRRTLDSRREWSTELEGWIWAEPTIGDTVLYTGTLGGKVYALDLATGRSTWVLPTQIDGQVIGSPVIIAGPGAPTLAVPSSKEDVWLLDLRSGSVLGEFNTRAAVDASPVVRDGFLYIHSRNDQLQTFAVSSRARVNCIETIGSKACS